MQEAHDRVNSSGSLSRFNSGRLRAHPRSKGRLRTYSIGRSDDSGGLAAASATLGSPSRPPIRSITTVPAWASIAPGTLRPTALIFRVNMRPTQLPVTPSRARGPRRLATGGQIGTAILDRERSRGSLRDLFRSTARLGEGQQAGRHASRPCRGDRQHSKWRASHAPDGPRGDLAGPLKATHSSASTTRPTGAFSRQLVII